MAGNDRVGEGSIGNDCGSDASTELPPPPHNGAPDDNERKELDDVCECGHSLADHADIDWGGTNCTSCECDEFIKRKES